MYFGCNNNVLFSSHFKQTYFKKGCHLIFHTDTFSSKYNSSGLRHTYPFYQMLPNLLPTIISHITDTSLTQIKDCLSTNKQFNIDFFLGRYGFFLTFTLTLTVHHSDPQLHILQLLFLFSMKYYQLHSIQIILLEYNNFCLL